MTLSDYSAPTTLASLYLRHDEFSPRREDARAVAHLATVNCRFKVDGKGRVYFVAFRRDFSDSDVPAMLDLPSLVSVAGFRLSSDTPLFTDDGFARLMTHPRLAAFMDQNNPQLTDVAAVAARLSDRLRWLNLPFCGITDAGVHAISDRTEMLAISLIGNCVTDHSVPHLCKLVNLRRLSVRDTLISALGVENLSSSLPRLRELN